MKPIRSAIFVFILQLIIPGLLTAQKSEEELNSIQKEIQDYSTGLHAFLAPVQEQYQLTEGSFENQDLAKVSAEIDKLNEVATKAISKIDDVPLYKNETWLKPVVRKYAVEVQDIAKTQLSKLLLMRKTPSNYTKQQYTDIVDNVRNRMANASRSLHIGRYYLFAHLWAKHITVDFCKSFHLYSSSMKDNFESIKSDSDPDMPMTWNCAPPFFGAKQSYISRMGKATCTVRFYSSRKFEEAKAVQEQVWVYALSCEPQGAYVDCFTQASQVSVDVNPENTIDYIVRFNGGDEAIVRLKKSLGEYVVEFVFQPSKYR